MSERTMQPVNTDLPHEPLWERQPGETTRYYQWFRIFLALPPLGRSINRAWAVAKEEYGTEKEFKGPGGRPLVAVTAQWKTVARRFRWEDRAEAYDNYLSRMDEVRWLARREELRSKEWEVAAKLLDRAEQMLKFPLAKSRTEADGRVTIIEPTDWSFSDIPRVVETASKIARLAADMRPKEPSDFDKMDAEELKAFIQAGLQEMGHDQPEPD